MDFESYIMHLTNNERAVLLWAGNALGHRFAPERTASLAEELSMFARRNRVPVNQIDRAVQSLLDKGLITMEAIHGNWQQRSDYSYTHFGPRVPNQKVFAEKLAGNPRWKNVHWTDIAHVSSVDDVKAMRDEWFDRLREDHYREQIDRANGVLDRQKELIDATVNACREFLAVYESGTELFVPYQTGDSGHWTFYTTDASIRSVLDTSKALDNWATSRSRIEREGLGAEMALNTTPEA